MILDRAVDDRNFRTTHWRECDEVKSQRFKNVKKNEMLLTL
jgi:ribulose bisphosphate carboxylase small subunit